MTSKHRIQISRQESANRGNPVLPGKILTRRNFLSSLSALSLASLPATSVLAQEISPMMSRLSGYMAAAKDQPLPAAVVEKAKYHILDTLAAMISGSELDPGHAALRMARSQMGQPVATVVGSDILTSPIEAALANGVLAHSDETDDSHGPSQSHPGAAVVPAALAVGEQAGASGRHFLHAVTLGYDIGCRLTMALGGPTFRAESRRSTHALAGNFGAAAAAGCLSSFNDQEMRWLLDFASQQASGYAVWGRDTGHIEKGFVFGGMPARNGVTSALLVQAGWTGVDDVFSGEDNFFGVNAPNGNPMTMIDGLGEVFEITNTDIKKWTVGSPIQAPLDAVYQILQRRPFDTSEVERVEVHLAPSVGMVVNNRDIADICLQHMVAVMLIDKTASFHAAHDQARMQDPETLRQRAKVIYIPDESLNQYLPTRAARVEISFTDGSRDSETVEAVRGTARNPMPREEVVDKARDLIAPVLGSDVAERLIATILDIESVEDVRSLRPLLQKG